VQSGEPRSALELVQSSVKKKPADTSLRVFLFELLAVLGDWDRAEQQLDVIQGLGDADSLVMSITYSSALQAERQRQQVFAGQAEPSTLGQSEQWVGDMVKALGLLTTGDVVAAARLRDGAFEAAPARPGLLNDTPFTWVADADPRIGPCLEVIVNSEYYWVPSTHIKALTITEPENLRDLVWLPVQFEWMDGEEKIGLIPVRYPGSETSAEGAVNLSRTTLWNVISDNYALGIGQRQLATDSSEYALLDIRSLSFDSGTGIDSKTDVTSDVERRRSKGEV